MLAVVENNVKKCYNHRLVIAMNGDYTVYMHIAPNGKKYIGITKQKPVKRWLHGKGYQKQEYFFNAILKYGWDNLKHQILIEGLTREQAEEKQKEYIKKYKTNIRKYGYNIENGGRLQKVSQETKEKLRLANLGKRHSQETCEKFRELERQRWLDPEYRDNQVKKRLGKTPWNKGKKTPLEVREKQSKAKIGRELSLEEKEALRQKYLGLSTPGNTKKVQCGAGIYSGANNPRSRKVINLDTGKIYESIGLAAKHFNVANGSHIVAVCKGKRKIAHGYHWKYADEKTE